MLAATPERTHSLELVRLALQLVCNNEQNIPVSLKEYFDAVLKQARGLVADPMSVVDTIMPESIDLALEIKSVEEFSKEIETISEFNEISPELATRMLQTMEKHPVYQD